MRPVRRSKLHIPYGAMWIGLKLDAERCLKKSIVCLRMLARIFVYALRLRCGRESFEGGDTPGKKFSCVGDVMVDVPVSSGAGEKGQTNWNGARLENREGFSFPTAMRS